MKHLLLPILLLLLIGCSEDLHDDSFTTSSIEEPNHDLTKSDINAFIRSYTNKGQIFDWSAADNQMIFAAAQMSDQLIAIGYQKANVDIENWIGKEETLPSDWIAVREAIVNEVLEVERAHTANPDLTAEDIIAFGLDDQIPTLSLKITSFDNITALRGDERIRYIEPMGFEMDHVTLKSSSGCSGSPNYGINGSDYQAATSHNAKVPWNFYNHNIPAAWGQATGDNIGLCIIDTGASDNQDNLGSQFASGNSPNRSISKKSTHYTGSWWWKKKDSPHDQCGHGTSMAGLAGAPWSTDGNALGVAYRSNVTTIRAVADVLISSSNEKNGVKEALKIVGNTSSIKIASLSIGNIISSGTVRDGVYYAYNRGKLLFAAAGTSTSFTNWAGVIFPASMSQCVAVTGVKDQSSYQRCNTCHSGSKVDFTIQMQRSYDNDRTSVALATSANQPKYISGSSAATATTAGIAALVWSTNSSMSRSQIINRLKVASDIYPSRNGSYGWGNINALAAVQGTSY